MTLVRLGARTILMMVASLMLWAVLPAAWGWLPTTVMSDSMAPRIMRGDIVVSVPLAPEHLQLGKVALVEDPDHPGRLRFHRVIAIANGEITTKGDANPQADSTPVAFDALKGVGALRVPYLGYPIVWLRERDVLPLLATAVSMTALLLCAFSAGSPGAHAGGHRRGHGRGHGSTAVAALAVAGMLAGAALIAPAPAHASFTGQSASPGTMLSAATSFDCLTPAHPNSPYLYYDFAEASGSSVHDSSGNGHTGTLGGEYTRLAGSCSTGAPAVTFGNGGFVSTPSGVTGPTTFSIELWFRTTTTTGGRLIGFGNSQTGTSSQYDRHVYMTDAGGLVFGTYVFGYDTISTASSYNDGLWHHVVATLSISGMRLYVDGGLRASNPLFLSAESDSGYWRIGYDNLAGWPNAPSSASFEGTITDAAVYPSALTPLQVVSHYASGR